MTNSPSIEEQRYWLNAHKAETGLSWNELQPKVGVSSALSAFAVNKYMGDNGKIGEAINRYRQLLIAQAEVQLTAPELPPYFETPSTKRMVTMFNLAQRGRITLIAGGPGTSKTKAIEHYRARVANVWVVTLSPSSAGVMTMQRQTLRALGDADAKGMPFDLSNRIMDRLSNSDGLIVFDEAHFATEKALEEIRSWHDQIGIGICLVGNEDVLRRLEHGGHKGVFARLASRVGPRMIMNVSSDADAMCLADAWGIKAPKIRNFIAAIAKKPGSLRNCTMMLETASTLALSENEELNFMHVQDAWVHLSTRQIG